MYLNGFFQEGMAQDKSNTIPLPSKVPTITNESFQMIRYEFSILFQLNTVFYQYDYLTGASLGIHYYGFHISIL